MLGNYRYIAFNLVCFFIILCIVVPVIADSIAVAPTAGFDANPVIGTAPLNVQFTDSSSNDSTGWAWYFGDENFSAPWTRMNASVGWSTQWYHLESVAMPDGNIVIMGMNYDAVPYNDVWRSTDNGATWTQVEAGELWGRVRAGYTSVALKDNSIVLMGGGDTNGIPMNDVWRSIDGGATWTQVNSSAGWTPRICPSSVVLPDGSIVLMGGNDLNIGYRNDVWRSTDGGETWTEMNSSAGWATRAYQSSVAMPDGSIVLMGGTGNVIYSDVWQSTDNGATWIEMNANAGWAGRYDQSSVALPEGSILLMGGHSGATYYNDTWRSRDNGVTWTEINSSAGWTARAYQGSIALSDGSIVLVGGNDDIGPYRNDVWRLMSAGSSIKNPSHTYTSSGTYAVTLQAYNSQGYDAARKTSYIIVTNSIPSSASITDLKNVSYLPTSINWTWTDPADADFDHVVVYLDGTWMMNVTKGIRSYNATGLLEGTSHTIATHTVDSTGNINQTWVNSTATTSATTPHELLPLPGLGILPTDPDSDGQYEDLDGNGEVTFRDVIIIFQDLDWIAENEPIALFDYNRNGSVNFADVLALFEEVSKSTPATIIVNSVPTRAEVYLDGSSTGYFTNTSLQGISSGTHRILLNLTGYEDYTNEVTVYPGDILTMSAALVPLNSPVLVANFTAVPDSGVSPLNVQFTDTSFHSAPVEYQWSFGDGTPNATGQNPDHTFTSTINQSFTVTLTISQDEMFSTFSGLINVTTSAPVGVHSAFTANQTSGTVPFSVEFTDSSSGSPSVWLWDFGDSTTSGLQNPVHTFTEPGNFTVNLTVINQESVDSSVKPDFIIANAPIQQPSQMFYGTATLDWLPAPAGTNVSAVVLGITNTIVTDEQGQYGNADSPGKMLVIQGDIPEGSPITFSLNGEIAECRNPCINGSWCGSYPFTAGSTTQLDLRVGSTKPVADFIANQTEGTAPLTIQFNDTSLGNPNVWSWDFGDKTTSNLQNPVHTYTTPGTYAVNLTVTNHDGSATLSRLGYIHVGKPSLYADFMASPTSGKGPLTVTFTGLSEGAPDHWSYNFGDGFISSSKNPVHTYHIPGTYNVTLTILKIKDGKLQKNAMVKQGLITVNG